MCYIKVSMYLSISHKLNTHQNVENFRIIILWSIKLFEETNNCDVINEAKRKKLLKSSIIYCRNDSY